MKGLIGILLIITTILCSCTTDIIGEQTTTDTARSSEVTTNEALSSETTDGEPFWGSHVREVREYTLTQLTPIPAGFQYGTETNVYMRNEHVCVFEEEKHNGHTRAKLTVFDEFGTSEIVYPPEAVELLEPQEDGTVECDYIPKYACPLSDEKWLIVYGGDMFKSARGYLLCIVDQTGETVKMEPLPNEIRKYSTIRVDEDDDGLHILISASGARYYFDESLTLQQSFPETNRSTGDYLDAYMGDGVYRNGWRVNDLMDHNVRDGEVNSVTLRLPRAYLWYNVRYGGNDALYLEGSSGIIRYDEDRQPETILKWSECGFTMEGIDHCMMLNDHAMFLIREEEYLGRTSLVMSLLRIESRPLTASDKPYVTLVVMDHAMSNWLNTVVYRFNQTNTDYNVNLVHMETNGMDNRVQKLNEILLNGSADMLMPDVVSELAVHFDKDIFVDLNPYLGDRLLGCISRLYGQGDAMYILPMAFSFTTLVAKESLLHGEEMTWDTVYRIRDTLPEDAILMALEPITTGTFSIDKDGNMVRSDYFANLPQRIYEYGVSDYANRSTGAVNFDSEGFCEMITFLQWLSEHVDENAGGINLTVNNAKISNPTLLARLREDGAAFADVQISRIEHFSMLQRMYGDENYTLCGYPSENGGYIRLQTADTPIAILESSEYKDGCIAFLEFLLSDEMQLDPSFKQSEIPVTKSALRAILAEKSWYYYPKSKLDGEVDEITGVLRFEFPGVHHEYVDDYGAGGDTRSMYEVFEMTEADMEAIVEFFDTVDMRDKADEKILEIVNEELSYWQNNARSLEETAKIIDSRVWIYVNE